MKTSVRPKELSLETSFAIRQIPHFRDSVYADLDIDPTLEFYRQRYHAPSRALAPELFLGGEGARIADVGCGYGWLAISWALEGQRVIAIDLDAERLDAGRAIAERLGVAEAIDWRVGSVTDLPLDDGEVDLAFCVEVLEHIQRDRRGLDELARATRDALALTTPNLWFPVIAHDTQLPLCHWLPKSWRIPYAKAFGRTDCENDNLFFSPREVSAALRAFDRVSTFLHFPSIEAYYAQFPQYLPYVGGGWTRGPGRAQGFYYRAANLMGRHSFWLLPNLASFWRRRDRSS